jgi:hypothetical protein
MDDGPTPLEEVERRAVRRQARRVHVRAAALAVALTAAAWLLPG